MNRLTIDPVVLKALREIPKPERLERLATLIDLAEAFGRPHLHTGLGIRKLGDRLYECRSGLQWRFLFLDRGGELFISFLGNHDDIKALIRRRS